MKARVLPKQEIPVKQTIPEDLINAYEKYIDSQIERHSRGHFIRWVKILCLVLHDEYGFGARRLRHVVDKMHDVLHETKTNPFFWEDVDKRVIRELKMPFYHEVVDRNGKVLDPVFDEDGNITKSVIGSDGLTYKADCWRIDSNG